MAISFARIQCHGAILSNSNKMQWQTSPFVSKRQQRHTYQIKNEPNWKNPWFSSWLWFLGGFSLLMPFYRLLVCILAGNVCAWHSSFQIPMEIILNDALCLCALLNNITKWIYSLWISIELKEKNKNERFRSWIVSCACEVLFHLCNSFWLLDVGVFRVVCFGCLFELCGILKLKNSQKFARSNERDPSHGFFLFFCNENLLCSVQVQRRKIGRSV